MASLIPQAAAGGTGSMTLAGPATNANQTITFPDETGTVVTTGSSVRTQKGVPAFSAYLTANQSVTNAATKVALNAELFDTTNAFDSTTNYRFQPTVAGYYQISGCVYCTGTSGFSSQYYTIFYKNGAAITPASMGLAVNSTNGPMIPVSAVVYLNGSTDYVELFGWAPNGAGVVFAASNTYFTGILIAAA